MNRILMLMFVVILCSCDYTSPVMREENRMYAVAEVLGRRVAEDLGMELLGVGSSLHVDGRYSTWSLSFVDRRARKISEGRKDIVHVIDAYWKNMQENPEYKRHDEWYQKNLPETYERYGKMNIDWIGARLAYWDEETNRRAYPYLAQIRVADSEIFYYYADPKTQELTEPIVETFEEARKNAKRDH